MLILRQFLVSSHRKMKMMKLLLRIFLLTILACFVAVAEARQGDYLRYFAQMNAVATDGDNAPYWLTANRQGLVPVACNSVYDRFGLEYGGNFRNEDFS